MDALFEQVKWERDIALLQLEAIGASLGEKMDDYRRVVRCGDCMYRREDVREGSPIRCVTGSFHQPDFYCAFAEAGKSAKERADEVHQ